MQRKDRLGLITLVVVVAVVAIGFWFTMTVDNPASQPTGGTPFAQQPPPASGDRPAR